MAESCTPEFDIILFGATSFVGKIACTYFIEQYSDTKNGSKIKWAMAARSQEKLNQLKLELGDEGRLIPTLLADSNDEASLLALAKQTKVVISTVGPYALYGSKLVKVCAENGTDYCDLTGEPQWIHNMQTHYEDIARVNGARIVHCCGFDSLPSDLGVHYLQKEAKELFGETCPTVKMSVRGASGTASGGTIASIINSIKEAAESRSTRRIMANPYATCPAGVIKNPKQKDFFRVRRDSDFKTWLSPFVMATINTRVVLRSNALKKYAYGEDFYYEETMMTKPGLVGAAQAYAVAGGLSGIFMVGAIKPVRDLLEKYVLPKPGEGPTEQQQLKGFFNLHYIGKTKDGKQIKTKVTGDRDPGYGSTAKMLAETAICLANDVPKRKTTAGFPTPAFLMGDKLIERLQNNAGLTFETISHDQALQQTASVSSINP